MDGRVCFGRVSSASRLRKYCVWHWRDAIRTYAAHERTARSESADRHGHAAPYADNLVDTKSSLTSRFRRPSVRYTVALCTQYSIGHYEHVVPQRRVEARARSAGVREESNNFHDIIGVDFRYFFFSSTCIRIQNDRTFLKSNLIVCRAERLNVCTRRNGKPYCFGRLVF